MEHTEKNLLHIAMFPWLAYGHLMPFLEVSKFLAQQGHRISFISTPKNLHRLPTSSLSPLIKLIELPMPAVDGLPQSAESTADIPINKVPYLKKAYDKLELPLTHCLEHSDVDWIVHDFASHWLPRAATRLGINSVYFTIVNATSMAFFGPPSELLAGQRQRPEDFTVVPEWIDFPDFNVAFKLHEMVSHWDSMEDEVSDFRRLAGVIQGCDFVATRTCPEFDGDSLSLLPILYGKPVVPVGLLPPVLQEDQSEDDTWRVLREWLDKRREKSVIYIALGTEVTLSQEAMHELARGIEKSGLCFIWVLGNRQVAQGPDIIPVGFETRVRDRGLVWRGWAPQLRVLGHSSIGGFLTHCGWSSVIEALGFGRVLILFSGASSDQGLIARLMHNKRVGLEIPRDDRDGSFSSEAVAESIRRVMVDREGEPLRANAWAMKEVFGNLDLNNRYLDEFTQFLETWPASMS
ncbi:UDP-glycosyltransferase 91C1-like [Rosa rugosa]|uniref:UDP-glycosyltransferase 91C1-like n=1 Tax=Rosa rugosa TaxID=74645 RepID=UPI002B412AB5|nr:UDP-glycosyltransferase 91C1-like [Rosa rugosa]